MGHELYAQPLGDAAVRGPATGFSGPVFDHGNNPAKLRILNGRRLAVRVFPAPGSTDDRLGRGLQGGVRETTMQLLLLVGSIVLSVGAALGTASLFLSLLLRLMSKLR
jgi:hypothetical protein